MAKRTKPAPNGGGIVASVRRSNVGVADESQKRKVTAYNAGEACSLFGVRQGKGGGAAFERWCRESGIDPDARREEKDWAADLQRFADRPIHGHRRGKAGGNHRINKGRR
jgi:hypothetical protein